LTETRWHTARCGSGHTHAAHVPVDVADAPCYGPGLASLTLYLVVYQHIPVERAAALIADVTGAAVSTGWVASLLPRAADLVGGSVRLIRALLALGHVLHADETTTNLAGKRGYPHVACTRYFFGAATDVLLAVLSDHGFGTLREYGETHRMLSATLSVAATPIGFVTPTTVRLAGLSQRAGRQRRRPARSLDLVQLAVQDSDGTLLTPFDDPRRPNVVLPPAPIAPL
jgi:hypothetical protein